MEQQIQLNDHNKQEYPPMHTAEHLLNATMVKTFGCPLLAMPTSKEKKANVTIYFRHVRQRNKSSLLKIE